MQFARRLTVALAVLGLLAALTAPAAAAREGEGTTAERRSETNGAEPFARLSLDGSEIIFYMLMADSGEMEGIGVSQYVPVGGLDPASVRELGDANPHELFYALSKSRTEIPGILREYYDNRYDTRPQGWGLFKIKPFIFNLFSCPLTEQYVANAVAATGLPHSYNELSKGPHNWGLWFVEDPNDLFPTYETVNGVATVGDAYYHVMLCDEDPMFASSNVVNVRLHYEESDDDTVLSSGELLQWQLDSPGDQMSFMSWPFDTDLSGDNLWFWLLTVEHVHLYDTLHIGTAWS